MFDGILDAKVFGTKLTVRDTVVCMGISLATGAIAYGAVKAVESFTDGDGSNLLSGATDVTL